MDHSFLAENYLERLSPELHKRYTGFISTADELLGRYLDSFPEFTDHSLLHSVEVADIANRLIINYIDKLNAEELYILLMAALLHDIGMGYGADDLDKKQPPGYASFLEKNSRENVLDFIRSNHHDLGALFVMENWQDCLIPDEKMAEAIAETGRGHRKTDLTDTSIYPPDLKLGDSTVNLQYLTAVIRLADEMDVSSSRNLQLLFTGYIPTENVHAVAFQTHRLLKNVFEEDKLTLKAQTGNIKEYNELITTFNKLNDTLEYCNKVVESCTGISLPVRHLENGIILIDDSAPLVLDDSRSGDTLTISLKGKLDTTTFSQLDELLSAGLGGKVINLIMDFNDLTYLSSAGLRIILGAKRKTSALNGEMKIINISENVMLVFRMTGFDSMLDL